jgi:Ca2+-binding RTX toxin-like protein
MLYGDINGDGRTDLVLNHTNEGRWFYVGLGQTTGGFSYFSVGGYDPGWGTAGIYSLADINGDGRAELVFAADDGSKKALFFKANGTVDRALTATATKLGETVFGEQLYADFNGDGVVDSLWRDPQNLLSIALGSEESSTGRISFGGWTTAGFTAPAGASFNDQLLAADINGDRKADLLWVKPGLYGAISGAAQVFRNTGTGTGVSWSPLIAGGSSTGMSNAAEGLIELSDINGDGRLDLLRTVGTTAKAWLGQATGALGSELAVSVATEVVPAGGTVLNLSGRTNTLATLLGSVGNDTLTGTAWSDELFGGPGSDTLEGGGGNDTLVGGPGNDILRGGPGGDTYVFSRGDGRDRIIEDAPAWPEDTLVFDDDSVSEDQLWFRRPGGSMDLEISLVGTDDAVTIDNWFQGQSRQVERIVAGTGRSLLAAEVNALVNAMAAFTPPAAGQLVLGQQTAEQLRPTLAAVWRA